MKFPPPILAFVIFGVAACGCDLAFAAEAPRKIEAPPEKPADAGKIPTRIPGTPEEALLNLYQRIAKLEQQVQTLQKAAQNNGSLPQTGKTAANRVVAPFEVVDTKGQLLFRVKEFDAESSRGAYVYNDAGAPVSQLGVYGATGGGRMTIFTGGSDVSRNIGMFWSEAGPIIRLRDDGSKRQIVLDRNGLSLYNSKEQVIAKISDDDEAGWLTLSDAGGKAFANLTHDESGGALVLSSNAGKKFAGIDSKGIAYFNSQGKAMARMGGVDGGGGMLLLGTPTGETTVSLYSAKTGPALWLERPDGMTVGTLNEQGLHVYNAQGKPTVSLSHMPSGNGVLQVFNASGETRVEAGTTDDGTGVVHAGPIFRCVAVAGPTVAAGLPDCIKGRRK